MMVSSMNIVLSPAQLQRGSEIARERARWAGHRTDIAAPPQDDGVTREAVRQGFTVEVGRQVSAELKRIGGDPKAAIASGWVRHSCLVIARQLRKQRGLP